MVHMHTQENPGEVRVALFVRDQLPPPTERQTQQMKDRLDSLENREIIETFITGTWPRRVPLGGTDSGIRDRYLAYTAWARAAGVELTPFFGVRECYSPGDDERTDWLVLPAMCLTVTVGDSLSAVYPHQTDEGCVTVADGLERLERRLFGAPEQSLVSAD